MIDIDIIGKLRRDQNVLTRFAVTPQIVSLVYRVRLKSMLQVA